MYAEGRAPGMTEKISKLVSLFFSPAPGTCVDCDGLRSRASALLSELEAARRDGERAREEAEEARGKAEKEVR